MKARPPIGVGAMGGELLQVMAGAEHRAFGGQHDGAHAGSSPASAMRRLQRAQHGFRQAVAPVGARQREERDRPRALDLQIARAWAPSALAARRLFGLVIALRCYCRTASSLSKYLVTSSMLVGNWMGCGGLQRLVEVVQHLLLLVLRDRLVGL